MHIIAMNIMTMHIIAMHNNYIIIEMHIFAMRMHELLKSYNKLRHEFMKLAGKVINYFA